MGGASWYSGMARPLRIELAGGLYHVMSRGNERLRLFATMPTGSGGSTGSSVPCKPTAGDCTLSPL